MYKYYEERCNALRHYSTVIMDLRKVTIVQGFVVITASFFLMKENLFVYSGCLSLFGLVFTAILTWQLKNDMANFESFESQITKNNGDPWIKYYKLRKMRLKNNRCNRFFVIYGPSSLIGFTFFLAIIGASAMYCMKEEKKVVQKQVVEIIMPSDVEVKINKRVET